MLAKVFDDWFKNAVLISIFYSLSKSLISICARILFSYKVNLPFEDLKKLVL